MLLLLALACGPASPDDTGKAASDDVDADGYPVPDDCDDADPDIHPGAAETCDGTDQDCDGDIDEDPTDGVMVHPDGDGDGHGAIGEGTRACTTAGGVSSADDCDDADPDVYPGAAELCDGLDQDCDTEADEGLATTPWFRDADDDGAGDPSARVDACAAPDGYIAADGDCDDADPDIHPGALDPADDGIDQDCDGTDATCVDADLGDATGEVARGTTAVADDWAPSCVTPGGGDRAYTWTAPRTGVWRFSTAGSGYAAAIALYREGCDADELACVADGADSTLATWANAGDTFTVVVDGADGDAGDFVLSVLDPGTTYGTVASGSSLTCKIEADGTAGCYGITLSEPDPADLFTFVAVGAGHACGIHTDGTVDCWGSNTYGESRPPAEPFTSLDGGMTFAMCGTESDGDGACWGEAGFGETTVPSGVEMALVTLGYTVGMGLEPDGTAHGWGDRTYGESTPPAGRWVYLAAGHWTACGITDTLGLDCWGSDTFGLTSHVPAGDYVQLSIGSQHACAIDTGGSVHCWGSDTYGRATPPSGTFTEVSAGYFHTCGRRTDGTVECWGADFYGESSGPEGI